MTSFRIPHSVERRAIGGRNLEGVYTPGLSTSSTILASIQPVSALTYARVQTTRGGRAPTELLMVITSDTLRVSGKDGFPGDLVQYMGEKWAVISYEPYLALNSARVSHNKYLIIPERELAVAASDVPPG